MLKTVSKTTNGNLVHCYIASSSFSYKAEEIFNYKF